MNKRDTVAVIRSLLTSSTTIYTIYNLNTDFKNETGIDIPLFGYANLSDFLYSIPDTVKVTGIYPIQRVFLVTNEKSAHIQSLVKRQRNTYKKGHFPKNKSALVDTRTNAFPKYETFDGSAALEGSSKHPIGLEGSNNVTFCENFMPTNTDFNLSSEFRENFVSLRNCSVASESIPHINVELHAQVGGYVEVIPCHICNPHKFYFHFRKLKRKFLDFMDKLQSFYKTHDVPRLTVEEIRPNMICVVFYESHTEALWHRAHIHEVLNNSQVIVNFLDRGDMVKISKENLQYLHRDFISLPRQAFLGSLANVRPSGGSANWSSRAISRFCDLSFQKDLIAGVVHVSPEDFSMRLALSCTKGLEYHINDTLVKEGLAEFDKGVLKPHFSEVFQRIDSRDNLIKRNPNKNEFLREKVNYGEALTEDILKSLESNFPPKFRTPVFYFSSNYSNNSKLKKMFSFEEKK